MNTRVLEQPLPSFIPGRTAQGDQASRLRSMMARAFAPPPALAAKTARVPVVAITSGKGGVGKTNIAVNLCIAMAQLGCRTLLVDADLGMANADVLCGLNPVRRLDAAVTGPAAASTLVVDAPGGFALVPGSVGLASMARLSAGDRHRVLETIGELAQGRDLVVMDTGAGIGPDVLGLLAAADLTLVVATPEPTSIADAYALMKCVHGQLDGEQTGPGHALSLVINQARDEAEAKSVHRRIAGVCQRFLDFHPALMGWVPSDPGVAAAVRARKPFVLSNPRGVPARRLTHLGRALAARLELKAQLPKASWRQVFLRSLFRIGE